MNYISIGFYRNRSGKKKQQIYLISEWTEEKKNQIKILNDYKFRDVDFSIINKIGLTQKYFNSL